MVTGLGAVELIDAAHALVVERPEQDPDLVVDVDPGDVLGAARERAADAELERASAAAARKPPLGSSTWPVRTIDQAHAGALDLARRLLPLAHDLGVEALAGRRLDSSTIASPRSP